MQRLLLLVIPLLMAASWPTYQGDVQRSGIAKETLPVGLERVWTFNSPHAPRPAWPAPAPGDVAHNLRDLRAVLAFDRAFQTVAADGMVFFGSSADDKVYALDAVTGKVRWTFITGGPVRLAPSFADGKLYVGSDDGYVYCLSAADGKLLWRQLVHGPRRLLPGNGRMISAWPVRSSVVVIEGIAYASAGLFPKEGVYLAAFDAETGKPKWKKQIDASTQGYMLASDERLYVPTGRTTPAVFDRADGKQIGKLPGQGGTYALVMDNCVVCGPGVREKAITVADTKSSETIASFDGLSMIVDGHIAYTLSEDALSALNRTKYLELSRQKFAFLKQKKALEDRLKKKKPDAETVKKIRAELAVIRQQLGVIAPQLPKCTIWKKPCDCPGAMIKSGKTLYLGGPNKVVAVDTEKGESVWETKTDGNVNGLAIADGKLLATTDKGAIHCFGKKGATKESVVRSAASVNPFMDNGNKSNHAKWYEMAAKEALRDLPVELGYCLVLGSGDGRLIYELARQSKLKIVCIEPDAKRVETAREKFDRAGLLGVRVAFLHSPMEKWPLPSCFANLIVAGDASSGANPPPSAAEAERVLRPCGGRLVMTTMPKGNNTDNSCALFENLEGPIDNYSRFSFLASNDLHCCIITRKRLPGSGEWTHTFSDAANTSCSKDMLVGREIQVQWFGRPGPRRMVDRHFRNVPPLYKDGRLFVPGNDIIYAVDAYNGTVNWQAETPNSLRVGGFLDPSNMTLDEKYLYLVAEDKCHRFDVRSGKRDVLSELPAAASKTPREWGYIATVDDMLLGSSRSRGTRYHTITFKSQEDTEPLWHPNMHMALSHEVFAIDAGDGRRKWVYGDVKLPKRLIENTFTVANGKLYLVETTVPKTLSPEVCRLKMIDVVEGGEQHLVALDLGSGKELYRRKLDMKNFQQPVFMNLAEGMLLLSGSKIASGERIRESGRKWRKNYTGRENIQYYYQAFSAADGELRWKRDHNSGLNVDGGHGEYNRHPTLIDGIAYAWPYAYRLDTGEKVDSWKMDRRGHGCGNISASSHCMFWRGYNPWMFDLSPGGGPQRINNVTRPGCFINIIPAGGLIMIPEASSGCTCAYPMQMSMAYFARGPEK